MAPTPATTVSGILPLNLVCSIFSILYLSFSLFVCSSPPSIERVAAAASLIFSTPPHPSTAPRLTAGRPALPATHSSEHSMLVNQRKESDRSPTKLEIMERAYSGNSTVGNARSFNETGRRKQPFKYQEELEEEAVATNCRNGRSNYLFLAGVGAEREHSSRKVLQAKLHHSQATVTKYQEDIKRMDENFQKLHSWLSEVASVHGIPRPPGWNPSFRQSSAHSSHQANDQRNEEHESDSVTQF